MAFDKELVAAKLRRWEKYLREYRLPEWDRLPDLGLYMEQVTVLMRQYLDYLPPELKEEQFITASTMMPGSVPCSGMIPTAICVRAGMLSSRRSGMSRSRTCRRRKVAVTACDARHCRQVGLYRPLPRIRAVRGIFAGKRRKSLRMRL